MIFLQRTCLEIYFIFIWHIFMLESFIIVNFFLGGVSDTGPVKILGYCFFYSLHSRMKVVRMIPCDYVPLEFGWNKVLFSQVIRSKCLFLPPNNYPYLYLPVLCLSGRPGYFHWYWYDIKFYIKHTLSYFIYVIYFWQSFCYVSGHMFSLLIPIIRKLW